MPGLGFEVTGSFRLMSTTIRFADLLTGQPVVIPNEIHHRNETLAGAGDPEITLLAGRQTGPWGMGARLGFTVPVGSTVVNPFMLGREGLPHEHFQFGTGTFDPSAAASISHPFARAVVSVIGRARVPFYANGHGYQAGRVFGATLIAGHPLWGTWRTQLGADLQREDAETWGGTVETEGNLGRTDLRLLAGLSRMIPGRGTFALHVQLPLVTRSIGQQVRYPPSIAFDWVR